MTKKIIFLILIQLFLISCSSTQKKEKEANLHIDSKTYRAKGFDNRIRAIVLHYTAINNSASIRALTQGQVSSHYLITDIAEQPIYSLVDNDRRAWHAGKSSFNGRTNFNDISIGIEIVNMGYAVPKDNFHPQVKRLGVGRESFLEKDQYIPYDDAQIEKVGHLLKKLVEKHKIPPKMVVGHSDVAPTRKKDPGVLFPWKHFYEIYGVGAWYEELDKISFMNINNFSKLSIKDIKKEFEQYGYDMSTTESWDLISTSSVYAFQMHFRPENIDGVVDLETYAILKALNKKYK